MGVTSVGLREFRAHLAEHVGGDGPVAVTKHGRMVGVFIPVKADLTVERAALAASVREFQESFSDEEREAVLRELGIDPESA